VTPQSTVTSRSTPRAARRSTAAVERPYPSSKRLGSERAQRAQQDGGGADAVDVVVAEDGDPRPARDVALDQLGRRRDAGQGERIVAVVRLEEPPRVLDALEPAPRQHDSNRARDAQPGGKPLGESYVIGLASPARRTREHPTNPARVRGRNG
jgi:hypothetical protein